MTFYLKYRPQRLEELDLKDVRESLKKIVKSGKIPHAFLFSGPKGSGKTSAARVLAKIVNCERKRKNSIEPCNKCDQCLTTTKGGNLDVIELDAASHRGIDDARSLRQAVKLAPARATKKVYIIDECHMLTTEAANALLKTLEEPPAHVMFILATTNPEKLIETIRSRVTNIVFGKAKDEEVVRSLARVVKSEKLKIKPATLHLIAQASDGSFRDATKIVEQLVAEGKNLDEGSVEEFLFRRKTVKVDDLIDFLLKRDTKAALNEVERVISLGAPIKNYLEAILQRLRTALLVKVGMDGEDLPDFAKGELIFLIKLLSQTAIDIRVAVIEQLPLEIAIVEWCETAKNLGPKLKKTNPSPKFEKPNPAPARKNLKEISDEVWQEILTRVKSKNASVEALLRAASPAGFDGTTLTLDVYYRFHKERLEDSRHRKILEEVAGAVLGVPIKVVCLLGKAPAKKMKAETKKVVLTEGEDEDIIKVAKEIFES